YKEEPGLEVLEIVDRQRVQLLPVDGQDPPRKEPGVEREETCRFGRGRLHVTSFVADDECISIEDPDRLLRHGLGPPLADGARGRRHLASGRRWKEPLEPDQES